MVCATVHHLMRKMVCIARQMVCDAVHSVAAPLQHTLHIRGLLVQPIAFGVSFLSFQNSSNDLVSFATFR